MVARLHDDDGHISFLIQFASSFLHAQRDDYRVAPEMTRGWTVARLSLAQNAEGQTCDRARMLASFESSRTNLSALGDLR